MEYRLKCLKVALEHNARRGEPACRNRPGTPWPLRGNLAWQDRQSGRTSTCVAAALWRRPETLPAGSRPLPSVAGAPRPHCRQLRQAEPRRRLRRYLRGPNSWPRRILNSGTSAECRSCRRGSRTRPGEVGGSRWHFPIVSWGESWITAPRSLAETEMLRKLLPDDPAVLLSAALHAYPRPEDAASQRPFLEKALALLEARGGSLPAAELSLEADLDSRLDKPAEAIAALQAALTIRPLEIGWRVSNWPGSCTTSSATRKRCATPLRSRSGAGPFCRPGAFQGRGARLLKEMCSRVRSFVLFRL